MSNVWKKCPVDGTPFFEATPEYPLGRPAGAKFCSCDCETRARAARRGEARAARARHFYNPEVDGTLGGVEEQVNGGPEFVGSGGYQIRVTGQGDAGGAWVQLGDAVTAVPRVGGFTRAEAADTCIQGHVKEEPGPCKVCRAGRIARAKALVAQHAETMEKLALGPATDADGAQA